MAASPTTRSSSKPSNFVLDGPVRALPRVGPEGEKLLARLGIRTVADLLWHLPSRYEDYSKIVPLRSLREGETQTARAKIGPATVVPVGRRRTEL